HPSNSPFPYTTLFRSMSLKIARRLDATSEISLDSLTQGESSWDMEGADVCGTIGPNVMGAEFDITVARAMPCQHSEDSDRRVMTDRKSTRLNSSHEWN